MLNKTCSNSNLHYSNISRVFCKTAADMENSDFTDGLKSKVIEFNEDLYASFDIQAYKCLPYSTIDRNPLQYVLSFNPSMLLTNYCMDPLELYEID